MNHEHGPFPSRNLTIITMATTPSPWARVQDTEDANLWLLSVNVKQIQSHAKTVKGTATQVMSKEQLESLANAGGDARTWHSCTKNAFIRITYHGPQPF